MNERAVLEEFIAGKGLRHSKPREQILSVFLGIEKHVTIDELWAAVKAKHPGIGYATVYRTLKLLAECGLCSAINFEDGTTRYEHLYGHDHHDHIICTSCGRFVEVVDPDIERLQERLVKRYGFLPAYHRMNLYGTCRECRKGRRWGFGRPHAKAGHAGFGGQK
jgi:Fur family transcriptional regulator, ferric uptake regulator